MRRAAVGETLAMEPSPSDPSQPQPFSQPSSQPFSQPLPQPLPPEPTPPLRHGPSGPVSSPAHPGGWAAVGGFAYGVLGIVIGTGVTVAAVATGAALSAGKLAIQNLDTEVSAADLLILDRGIDALVPPMLTLGLGTLLLGVAATVAGVGVLRRSERARAALVGVLAASAVAAVAWCVYSIAVYAAAVHAWVEEYEEASSRLGLQADVGAAFGGGTSSGFSDACTAGIHLVVIAGLIVALRSASAGAWCGASAAPLSKQALERARLPR